MRVTIRGVTYESVPAAAEALGITPDTIHSAIYRNRLDTCGLGSGYRPPGVRFGGRPPTPIKIGPHFFSSIAELARFINRNPRDVRQSLQRGNLARGRIALAVIHAAARLEATARKLRNQEEDDVYS